MSTLTRKGKCCFCGEKYDHYGNSAEPVIEDGRCCDSCNWTVVVPVRFREFQEAAKGAAN
jgi:hypothetical protein